MGRIQYWYFIQEQNMFICKNFFFASTGIEITYQTLTKVKNMEIWAQLLHNYINKLITSPDFPIFFWH